MLNRMILLVLASGALWGRDDFRTTLFPILEKASCRACHNTEGVASATRLHFPEADADADTIAAFGNSLVVLVDRQNLEASLLLRKPTARMPHTGGERIMQNSPDEAVLKAWIAKLAQLSGAELATALRYRELESEGARAAQDAQLRRLTHSQYNHTVRDLLGDQTRPAMQFPPEDFVNGFLNQSRGQSLSPLLEEAYSNAAEKLARSAFRGGDTHGLVSCKPSPECGKRFVREFGRKAFRRPLETEEQQRYESLLEKEPDFLKGAQLVVEAMLQSPNFLFWINTTASESKWKAWATASRLSYSLWDTMPDAELFAAAERGELATRAGVEKQVRRMLADPRAHESLDEFVSQWLRFDRLTTASKDRRKFPYFTRETANAMITEARTFVSDLVWNDGNFMDLFTANYGYVSPELARIYGVPAPARDFERVAFPANSERAGILGQGLFLALTAKPEDSSPTARGLFVREQFLCQHVPDPPPGVNTNLPPVTEAKPQTNRDRMSEHTTNASCATCHKLMDAVGFGLEKFDAVGARREQMILEFRKKSDEDEDEDGKHPIPKRIITLPLNTNAYVAGIPNSEFSSPQQLGAVLANSSACQECVVKQYFRFQAGRSETAADRPLIRWATDDFRNSGFRFKELILSLVLFREFPREKQRLDVANNHQSR